MTGNNELRLNHATMIEAVQFWLNSQMRAGVKVIGVSETTGTTSTFIVRVTEPEPVDENTE